MTVFVTQGDAPLTDAQLQRRTQRWLELTWPQWKRERSLRLGDGAFDAYIAHIEDDTNARVIGQSTIP
jgi:aminoglycoside phosphotransferase (APT) family kinase protein